jgi:transcriptional regulator with XRE-family HTH domain
MSYGMELGLLRKARGMTQTQLAAKLNWTQARYSRIESGRQEALAIDVEDVLYALNATPAERARVLRVR